MFTRVKCYLYLAAFLCIFPCETKAFVSLQSTFSGGYYRDIEKESHVPSYFYWNYHQIRKSGAEGFIHWGVNNNVLQDEWEVYIYDAIFTIPLTQLSQDLRNSRIQIGRQFFSEGFELGLLDGFQMPIYWSSTGSIWLIGGGLHILEPRRFNFESQIYGGSLQEKILGFQCKTGYLFNSKVDNSNLHLLYGSLMRRWENLFLRPQLMLKGEINLEEGSPDQALAGVELSPLDSLILNMNFWSQERNRLRQDDTEVIYRLAATKNQKTFNASLTWLPFKDFQMEGSVKRILYKSQSKNEAATQPQVSLLWTYDDLSVGVYGNHMRSFGGKVWQGGSTFKKALSRWAQLPLEANVAKIEKINGITSWAYHGRGGINFQLIPRLLVSFLGEVERNHYYELDSRAILYVSHYWY